VAPRWEELNLVATTKETRQGLKLIALRFHEAFHFLVATTKETRQGLKRQRRSIPGAKRGGRNDQGNPPGIETIETTFRASQIA